MPDLEELGSTIEEKAESSGGESTGDPVELRWTERVKDEEDKVWIVFELLDEAAVEDETADFELDEVEDKTEEERVELNLEEDEGGTEDSDFELTPVKEATDEDDGLDEVLPVDEERSRIGMINECPAMLNI